MKNHFINDVFKLVSGTAFAQGLGIIALPIITRLYAPEVLGLSLIFISLITIFGAIACLRYEQAIMLPADNEEAVNLLAISLIVAVVITIVLTGILELCDQPLLEILNAEILQSYLWLFGPSVFVGAALHALNFWNSRLRKFGRLSIARILSAIVLVSMQIGAGLLGFNGAGSLIIAHFLGLLTTVLILSVQILIDESDLLRSSIKLRIILNDLKKYRKFPIYGTWSELLTISATQLPNLLLSVFFSPSVVGYYGLAARLLRMPITLLGNAISQVFYQRASIAYLAGELSKSVSSIFHSLFTLGIFPLVLLMLFGGDFFATLFGASWIESGVYVQILSPLTLLMFVGIPLTSLPNIMDRQEVGLTFSIALFVIQIMSMLVGGVTGNIYLTLICLTLASGSIWLMFFLWLFRNIGLSIKLVLTSLKLTVLLSCGLGGGLFIVATLTSLTQWFLLIFSIVIGFLYYLLLVGLDPQIKRYSQPYLYKIRKFARL